MNRVEQLCAEGMHVDGEPDKALALFMQAWELRTDDYDASVAAHFVARHQPTVQDTLHWNEVALRHADRMRDNRAAALVPSLCLNLADAYCSVGRHVEAEGLAQRGLLALTDSSPEDGYAQFVRAALQRVHERARSR